MAFSRQLMPSTARDLTTAVYSPVQNAQRASGARVDINLTVVTSSKNAVFTLQGKDPTAGTWVDLIASATKTATGAFTLNVHPAMAAATNVTANAILPSQIRLKCTGTDTLSEFSAHLTLSD